MKKKLVASLAAAMVLSVAGTSFAATNPFTDVPAKHWSYDAVTKLANAGIVDGYGDGTFRGDKTISRYEMAQIVAKAMAHSDQATAEQKASIDKLSVEFAEELEGLNVRVTKLEKNSSTIKVTGEARLRYENNDADVLSDNSLVLRSRIHLDGNINDQWSYYGRLQSENNLRGGDDGKVTMDNAYVKGNLFGTTATIGRFDYIPNGGMMFDSTLNGVNLEFGNVLKANVFYGKDNHQDILANGNSNWTNAEHPEVTGLTLDYAASKATSINGGYYKVKDIYNTDTTDFWEAGFATQLNSNWNLTGSYGESDIDVENTAYYAQLGYKGADKAKVGSYGAWVNYRNIEGFAAPRTTFDGAYTVGGQSYYDGVDSIYPLGGKGYEVGFNYTPMLNTVLGFKYADIKTTANNASNSLKTKFYQAQVEFFF
ncbi:S-layer homology domain-containing protein [Pelosinus fermentans]|uniref:UFO1_4202 family uranium-binding S-layer protein n=1 Tax=Pelosinus fermentans TaxID=365349 RepID=UPI0002685C0E|nr:S-layer homology domain-containing protein [Pelosinus fermentans]OAM92755.1 S-layer domain-containing protein [Pelosinus fermentans DSM 17108]SDQ55889.1 S-layer homology domain-containing protein [Pelosinus fermentans]